MQTQLAEFIRATPHGQKADTILRNCVHCGFCTATCPTYQLLGDELDGPRGRIYQIKQVLEGQAPTRVTQAHLDRCLTCRSCETTCPSGVRYGQLLDIGRAVVEKRVSRPPLERAIRAALRGIVPYPARFGPLLRLGQALRPILPAKLRRKVPRRRGAETWPQSAHSRTMLVLEGCAQKSTTPGTNACAARLLDRLGIRLVPVSGCCGAVDQHLGAEQRALRQARTNIDNWWPLIEGGAEALVSTASGCGVMVKDYGELLAGDPEYAERASRIAAITRDLSEIVAAEDIARLPKVGGGRRIAFHAPCSLQHGQGIRGQVELILEQIGYRLTGCVDSHLCCGSAGTYSILQPTLSQQLLGNKIDALQAGNPSCIATANVGCQLHLETASDVPVLHWVELAAPR